ncbi:class I adenylate-forming enzyme family protein [Pseudomonas sp. AN-1]|uniref:class I adenylate-forming enzyme family protein n=1 Tax=Pseudomonas sp. AN-1 TaxID=3096605 RepID=UPI002A6AC9D1|nr:class I adenylate-forming enzyme family protein [Pseudomonas sp. AN-1]WPP46488.1 class I adenylate-forming enzyme family protein [Pseudomonas sp. AN-1]
MTVENWQTAWRQLSGPGSPYEVVTPDDGSPRYFRNAQPDLLTALNAGRAHGEREFVVWEDQRLTFAEFFAQVDRLATQLRTRFGVRKGDRVAIAMRNQPAWLVAFVAAVASGAIVVPLNSWGQREELLHGLEDSGSRVLLCDAARLALVEGDLEPLDLQAIAVGAPGQGRWVCDYEALLAEEVALLPPLVFQPDDPLLILYTSGTTSKPKGVLSTHRAVCQALAALEFQGAFAAMSSPQRIKAIIDSGFAPTNLMAVPLFHVSGLHAQFLLALRGGRRLVLMYKWDAERALDLIERERCTQFSGSPAMMQQLLASPRFASDATASLFGLGLGGAAANPGLLAQLTSVKPNAIGGAGYGMTESNSIGAAIGGDQFVYKPACVGWPLPIVEVRIGDTPDAPQEPGVEGQIWLRSPTLMSCYWGLPAATAEALQDGWLATGDVGCLDEEGFLRITDRLKDLINRGGEKVAAAEVEACASGLDGVIEAAAFAVPDERMGEAVALVARVREGSGVDEVALHAHIAAHLAAFKVPEHLQVVHAELPRNASGKLLKRELREDFVRRFLR